MKIRSIISNPKFREVARFGLVGGVATLIQVVIYCLLAASLNHNLSLAISYIVSLAANFIMTVYFTFRVKPSVRRGVGFLFSHAVNFTLQFLLLNLAIKLGIGKQIAIMPVLAVCIPINFILVRTAMKSSLHFRQH